MVEKVNFHIKYLHLHLTSQPSHVLNVKSEGGTGDIHNPRKKMAKNWWRLEGAEIKVKQQ